MENLPFTILHIYVQIPVFNNQDFVEKRIAETKRLFW